MKTEPDLVTPTQSIDIVIASYKEDLLWTEFIPKHWRTYLYCVDEKRTEFPEGLTPTFLPNGGREAGQWLQHIVRNYGNFADYTLFLQGMPFPHVPTGLIRLMLTENFDHPICYVEGRPPDKNGMYIKCSGQIKEAFDHAYQGQEIPPSITFCCGAQFYVRKDVIMAHSKEFYERLLENAYDPKYFSFGHMMEPVWGCVFDWPKFL